MGNLEKGLTTKEFISSQENSMPPEVLEMDKNLVSEAKIIFSDNHELVKEAMFGMGSRKAKEVLQNLAECREQTKRAVQQFRKEKENTYPIS